MIDRCRRALRDLLHEVAERSTLPASRIKVWSLYAVTIVCVIVAAAFIAHAINKSDHVGSSRFKGIITACEDQNRRHDQAITQTRHQAARQIAATTVGAPAVKAALRKAVTREREELIDVELPVRDCVARARKLTQ